MADEFGPILNDTHLQQMQDALRLANYLDQEIARAKRAGLDVTQYEQQLADARQKILGIKNAYFPGR